MAPEIRKKAYARAGLIGNPSDGYNGKTIALSVKNFSAEVVLKQSQHINIIGTTLDDNCYESIHSLHSDISQHGYYGGIRLIKATIKVFYEYCQRNGQTLRSENFTLSYHSDIPQQVGLAGSSAIIVATLRVLMKFYSVSIDQQLQPSLVFSVEHDELGIGGGLQDRVIQVYEGLVAMDFSVDAMTTIEGFEVGHYTRLDQSQLPDLYIAYRPASSEPTEVFHNDLRERYNAGDAIIVNAMKEFAALTDQAVEKLAQGDNTGLGVLLDKNFDLRNSMCSLNPRHIEMISVARGVGVSAKYAGSGGAIVGCLSGGNEQYRELEIAMRGIGCEILKPII